MAPPPSRIYDVCADLLAAVVARHGGTLPDRQFVSAGAPAWDCSLVAAWCERTAGIDGDVAGETASALTGAAHTMRAGTFVVTIVRCTAAVPDGEGPGVSLPTVEQEDDAAVELYEDAQRCLNALVAAERAGDLPGCHSLVFSQWSPLGPQGGYVAGELRVRVGLATGM